MLKTKEDINQFVDVFKTMDSIYHRYKVRAGKVMYIDSSHGELIPFFNLKSEQILYCNTSRGDVLKNGLLKSKVLNEKVNEFDFEDEQFSSVKCGLVYINCNERVVKKFADYVELNGILISTFDIDLNNDSVFKHFSHISTINGLHVYKRNDCPFYVKSGNLFDKHIPIGNEFKYKCTSDVDVSLNIFKMGENRIRVCGLIMDSNSSCQVEVEVYSADSSEVSKFILSLDKPMLCQAEYEVPFGVHAKMDTFQEIPKVICQTLNENITSSMHFKTILNVQMLNPQYSYEFYNSRDRRQFISQFYNSDVLDAYDGLVSGAFKADLFRYCWLYNNGGLYVDCKMIQRVSFSDIIDPEDVFYLCEDRIPNAYQNCLIGAKSKQEDILQSIFECVKRFKAKIHHKVSFGSLYHTGPYLFYSCMNKHATKAAFRGPFRDLTYTRTGIYCKKTGLLLFNVWFKDYYQNYRKIHGKKIWSQDWAEGNIYYSKRFNIQNCEQYSIRIHPSELSTLSNLEEVKFVYKDGGYIYNNMKDNLRCQLIDEYQHIDQPILVEKINV